MEELLDELGIELDGQYAKSGEYVIDIMDSNEFGKVYSQLDRNEDIEEFGESNLVTEHDVSVSYLYDDYKLSLVADFDNDEYKLVITELEYEDDEDEYDDDEDDYDFDEYDEEDIEEEEDER